jgi:hypothetical protein
LSSSRLASRIEEPLVHYGPFVMNTIDEANEAEGKSSGPHEGVTRLMPGEGFALQPQDAGKERDVSSPGKSQEA